jgi:hypothetical protein
MLYTLLFSHLFLYFFIELKLNIHFKFIGKIDPNKGVFDKGKGLWGYCSLGGLLFIFLSFCAWKSAQQQPHHGSKLP